MLNATIVSIAATGRAYALLGGIESKSGVKQVDRLLSNEGGDLDALMRLWVQQVVGTTGNIVVAMDWTDFDDDDQTTLCVYLVTTHGRAMPLAWHTVKKSTLKKRRTGYEQDIVKRIHAWLPEQVRVTLLADRGFGYAKLYALLGLCGWNYIIRFRENILAETDGVGRRAADFVPAHGRARKIVGAMVTRTRQAQRYEGGVVSRHVSRDG